MTKEEIKNTVAGIKTFGELSEWLSRQNRKELTEAWTGNKLDMRKKADKYLASTICSIVNYSDDYLRLMQHRGYVFADYALRYGTVGTYWSEMYQMTLRDALHKIQMSTSADRAAIMLYNDNGQEISIDIGSDGIGKVAVLSDYTLIPAYYERVPFSISGKWYISDNDCSHNAIATIDGKHIYIYRAGKSVILCPYGE